MFECSDNLPIIQSISFDFPEVPESKGNSQTSKIQCGVLGTLRRDLSSECPYFTRSPSANHIFKSDLHYSATIRFGSKKFPRVVLLANRSTFSLMSYIFQNAAAVSFGGVTQYGCNPGCHLHFPKETRLNSGKKLRNRVTITSSPGFYQLRFLHVEVMSC